MNATQLQRTAWIFLALHVFSIVFGAVGLAVMVPNPELWDESELARNLFPIALLHGANMQIVFGTVALFAYGCIHIGLKNTSIFFVLSCVISLAMELLGTGTGWPFGDYEYTDAFGFKINEQVPPAVPLSWFYMGLASYLIADQIVRRIGGHARPIVTVLAGALLLTAWDLVLDPAMSHADVFVQYWVWNDAGPYVGMPLINFLGWIFTGVMFMGLSRMVWGADYRRSDADNMFLVVTYTSNVLFAIVLSITAGLWLPVALALLLCIGPMFLMFGNTSETGLRAQRL